MKKILILLLGLAVIFAGCTSKINVTNFDQCAAAGNPVMESYPAKCTANGQTYTEKIKMDKTMAFYLANNSECTQKAVFKDNNFYNNETNTWWIDLQMKPEFYKKACNPACVINMITRDVQINWRCTGLIPPDSGKLQAVDCTNPRQQACTKEYMPVCGQVQVECIRAPCPPIMQTFSNKCEACANSLTISYTDGACPADSAKLQDSCTADNGKWLNASKECEGISKDQCDSLGGRFDECASACRNDPNAQMCTMQCVIVCQF